MNDRPTGNLTESDPDPKRQEIYDLADALLSGEITATEANRLERLVCTDPAARRCYVRFMHQSAKLHSGAWREMMNAEE